MVRGGEAIALYHQLGAIKSLGCSSDDQGWCEAHALYHQLGAIKSLGFASDGQAW